MKTAVIYARYSSENQTKQSIDGQLSVCKEYAQRNGILILDTYIDRAMTGTNDNRPDFQRMIKDSARKEWNYILVYKLNRFSRDKYATVIHKRTLKNNGVKLLSAMENMITAIENGVITNSTTKRLKELESRQEELERQILIERSKTVIKLTERDIREYYEQALKLEPQMLINYLIKEIVLYDDKIEIHYNSPIQTSPDDNNRGFIFYSEIVKLNGIQKLILEMMM